MAGELNIASLWHDNPNHRDLTIGRLEELLIVGPPGAYTLCQIY